MSAYQNLNDSLWVNKYHWSMHSPARGKIVNIDGIGEKDSYNPTLCNFGGSKILAFRCEVRQSDIVFSNIYHPSILFAKQDGSSWVVDETIAPFDMLEDPSFMSARINNEDLIIFGGVRAKISSKGVITVNTELYKGYSLRTIERQPFVIIENMKDERLSQLPDGRFIFCRRPIDGGLGHAVVHIIDSIDELSLANTSIPHSYADLKGLYDNDWIGINNIYLLTDKNGVLWVGLLGHVASRDDHNIHYAVVTYKIKYDDLITEDTSDMQPTIIATRACFEDGPEKDQRLGDVVFPGSLEKIDDNTYRLWAGLSDARIGTLDIEDPFLLNS